MHAARASDVEVDRPIFGRHREFQKFTIEDILAKRGSERRVAT
jgi:hypothetical protein